MRGAGFAGFRGVSREGRKLGLPGHATKPKNASWAASARSLGSVADSRSATP